jgi:hypothetical protein
MANPKHLEILKQGVEVWNKWRSEHEDVRPDLSGAVLTNAKLMSANLVGANLSRAKLIGADFTNVQLAYTSFGDNDLSDVVGLDAVIHGGPSHLSIDTIYKSRGQIPEVFLRGCGVPDEFIIYMQSLTNAGQPIQFYSCFISHSTKDQRFCDRIFADLQAKGVRTWYFPEDARWGEPVWREIDQNIKVYDKRIVVCSKHSLQSGPVLREIERSLNREDRECKSLLFPVRIDNYIFDEWQHERKDDLLRQAVVNLNSSVNLLIKLLTTLDVFKGKPNAQSCRTHTLMQALRELFISTRVADEARVELNWLHGCNERWDLSYELLRYTTTAEEYVWNLSF